MGTDVYESERFYRPCSNSNGVHSFLVSRIFHITRGATDVPEASEGRERAREREQERLRVVGGWAFGAVKLEREAVRTWSC